MEKKYEMQGKLYSNAFAFCNFLFFIFQNICVPLRKHWNTFFPTTLLFPSQKVCECKVSWGNANFSSERKSIGIYTFSCHLIFFFFFYHPRVPLGSPYKPKQLVSKQNTGAHWILMVKPKTNKQKKICLEEEISHRRLEWHGVK